MSAGAGLIWLGAVVWAACWIADLPRFRTTGDFAAIRHPPWWLSIITGGRQRPFVGTMVVQLWGEIVIVVGLLIALQILDRDAQRPAVIATVFIGGAVVGLIEIAIVVGQRLHKRQRQRSVDGSAKDDAE